MIMENIHTLPMLDCLTDSCQASTQPAAVFVDLADIMRAYAEGMYIAFQMGQERAGMDMLVTSSGTTAPQLLFDNRKVFLGIYDNNAYGVYTDVDKYRASVPFWKDASMQEFSSYDEAVHFARVGVATLRGVPVSTIPALKYPENWRQII